MDEGIIHASLAQLRDLKRTLDERDAELGNLVPAVEQMLESLRLGVPISRSIKDHNNGWAEYLTFTKIGKNWRLCVEAGPHDGDPDDWTVTPISDISRDDRADILASHLPWIFDSAMESIRNRIKNRTATISSTKNLIEAVTKATGSHEHPAIGVFKSEDGKDPKKTGKKQ